MVQKMQFEILLIPSKARLTLVYNVQALTRRSISQKIHLTDPRTNLAKAAFRGEEVHLVNRARRFEATLLP